MLVQNSVYRNTYLTDGVNKDFYFSFPILEASQVLVQTSLLTDTDMVTTVDPGQYTVIGVGQTTGGHISFTTAPPTGSRIALTLNMPITQLYQYAELDSFPAKSHEDALAKLTLICQQLKEQISRAVLISTTSEDNTADVIASLYAARDSATTSAESAVAEAAAATLAATNAEQAATDAAQAAADAAANSDGLAAEVQNLSTMFIGTVLPIICADSYVPNGCVPTNGGEYTRAQFPTLYDTYLVGGRLLTCTYEQQAAQVGLTGNCGKFALDVSAQKFKVPLLKDGDSITQAASAAEIGKSVKAGLPNITATVGKIWGAETATGACSRGNNESNVSAGAGSVNYGPVYFDASRSSSVYGNSTTVTDEQVRLRYFVVVASTQNNSSMFDWSNYMAALNGKLNADLSNVDLNKANIVLQRVVSKSNTFTSISSPIPIDDTIPQNNEGVQIFSTTITPKKANSTVEFTLTLPVSCSGASSFAAAAIFIDSAANAYKSGIAAVPFDGGVVPLVISDTIQFGDTQPHTIAVRAGGKFSNYPMTINGGSSRIHGGSLTSTFMVEEYI